MPTPRSRLAAALLLLAACRSPTTALAPRLHGRWEKLEKSMPPIVLELRRGAAGDEGQVWLSGVTYTLPAVLTDTSVVLAAPASSKPAPFVGVLQTDGRLRVRLDGDPPHEASLVRRE